MRYCGRLREMIFFLSTATRATGDVRGVFGGPLATFSSKNLALCWLTRESDNYEHNLDVDEVFNLDERSFFK